MTATEKRDNADKTYDARVDEWLAMCDRAPDGYSSHSIDAMLAARNAHIANAAILGVKAPTAIELRAVTA